MKSAKGLTKGAIENRIKHLKSIVANPKFSEATKSRAIVELVFRFDFSWDEINTI